MMSDNGATKEPAVNIHDLAGDEHKSSVRLTQTTKGVTWEVKVYNDDPNKALKTAEKLFKECQTTYGVAVE